MPTPKPGDPKYPLVRYLQVEQTYMPQVKAAMQQATDDITRQLNTLAQSTNRLTRSQLVFQRVGLKTQIDAAFVNVGKITDEGQQAAMFTAYDTIYQYEKPLYTEVFAGRMTAAEIDAIARSQAMTAARGTRTLMDRLGGSKQPLSQSVYNGAAWSNDQLDKRINAALVRGLSAKDFARSIIDLVNPNTPGGASYAANRLARTELNNAFHVGSQQRAQQSGLVTAMEWHLSSSHPRPDLCNDYESDSPYGINEVPDKPHPQCFCYIVPELPTADQFIQNLLNGGYDDVDTEFMDAAKEQYGPGPLAVKAPPTPKPKSKDPADAEFDVMIKQSSDLMNTDWTAAVKMRDDWFAKRFNSDVPFNHAQGGAGWGPKYNKIRDKYVVNDDATLAMNRALRSGRKPSPKALEMEEFIEDSTVASDFTVYRGAVLQDDIIAQLKPGAPWKDAAFQSTDVGYDTASFYANARARDGAVGNIVMFHYQLETGMKARYVGVGEVVVQRNTAFVVEKVAQNGDILEVWLKGA